MIQVRDNTLPERKNDATLSLESGLGLLGVGLTRRQKLLPLTSRLELVAQLRPLKPE